MAPDPFMPSAAEVEEHRVTHWPYSSWCRECVEGKAFGEHQSHRRDHGTRIPVVGIDYFFMTSKGVMGRKELQEFPLDAEGEMSLKAARERGEIVKCVITRCSVTKCI